MYIMQSSTASRRNSNACGKVEQRRQATATMNRFVPHLSLLAVATLHNVHYSRLESKSVLAIYLVRSKQFDCCRFIVQCP